MEVNKIDNDLSELVSVDGYELTQLDSNYHTFVKKILIHTKAVNYFKDRLQEVDDLQKQLIKQLDKLFVPPTLELITRWLLLWNITGYNTIDNPNIKYNKYSGFFEYYDIKDITVEQAIRIINKGVFYLDTDNPNNNEVNVELKLPLFPTFIYRGQILNAENVGKNLRSVRTIVFHRVGDSENRSERILILNTRNFCNLCYNLEKFDGNTYFDLSYDSGTEPYFRYAFEKCSKLHTLDLRSISRDVYLKNLPSLKEACVLDIIENFERDSSITITLNSKVYDNLSEATFTAAANKNITLTK